MTIQMRNKLDNEDIEDRKTKNQKPENMSSVTTSTSTHSHPCILSCGYKSICIPKSGLEFPAWLVCFDTESDNEQEQGGVAAATVTPTCTTTKTVVSDDSIETRLPPYKTPRQKKRRRYFWRSKRDFWRLGRATASLSSSSQTIVLPKAAWKKMSNEAPWQRPDYNDYAPDIHNEEEKAHVHAHQNDGWKRHMYKSLRQVDQYLQQVQSICTNQDSCSCNNNNDSIRHDCNSMNSSAQQQCKTCSVRAAWKEFCRPCHTEDLKDKTTADCNSQAAARTGTVSTQSLPPATTPAANAMTGNALGQYFCHPANARQLVNVCLERIQQQVLQCKNHHGEEATRGGHQITQFLFVEPSCGHGQVLEALLDELGRRQQQQQQEPLQPTSAVPTRLLQLDLKQCSFVGMDIDPTTIAHCREYFSKRCSDNINTQPNITWMTIDFLQSQRSCVMDNLQVDGTRNSGTEDSIMVIVLGGPPYSAGAGHGGDGMQRDLPMRFVQHAIQEWRASIVTFLMPERCGQHVKALPATNLTGDPMQPNVSSNVEGYALANIPLEAPSVFYFQGLTTVKQPSIIQCFWRTAQNKSAPMLPSHTS